MPKYAARRDANESEIIAALIAAGYSVAQINARDVPDLIVGGIMADGQPGNLLMEVKDSGGKLSDGQRRFHADWRGPIVVVRSVEDALRAVGRQE